MTTTQTAPAAPSSPPRCGWAPSHLTVTDLDRSVAFYQDALGLRAAPPRRTPSPRSAPAARTSLVLHEEPRRPARRPPRRPLPLRAAVPLARGARPRGQRLAVTRTPIEGASDHGVSEAIYLPDPDGNGIELARRPPARRVAAARARRAASACSRAPLDVHGLLGHRRAARSPPRTPAPACAWATCTCTSATSSAALAFYRDAARLRGRWSRCPARRSSPAGGYHHHLGFNTWRGEGVRPGARRHRRPARVDGSCSTRRRSRRCARGWPPPGTTATRSRTRRGTASGSCPPSAARTGGLGHHEDVLDLALVERERRRHRGRVHRPGRAAHAAQVARGREDLHRAVAVHAHAHGAVREERVDREHVLRPAALEQHLDHARALAGADRVRPDDPLALRLADGIGELGLGGADRDGPDALAGHDRGLPPGRGGCGEQQDEQERDGREAGHARRLRGVPPRDHGSPASTWAWAPVLQRGVTRSITGSMVRASASRGVMVADRVLKLRRRLP